MRWVCRRSSTPSRRVRVVATPMPSTPTAGRAGRSSSCRPPPPAWATAAPTSPTRTRRLRLRLHSTTATACRPGQLRRTDILHLDGDVESVVVHVGPARAPLAAIEGLGHNQPPRVSTYAPNFVESGFPEVRIHGVLRSSPRKVYRRPLERYTLRSAG